MKVRYRTFFRNRILTNVVMSTPSDSEGQGRSARSKGFCVSKSFWRFAKKGVGHADHIAGAFASAMCRPPLCSFLLFWKVLEIGCRTYVRCPKTLALTMLKTAGFFCCGFQHFQQTGFFILIYEWKNPDFTTVTYVILIFFGTLLKTCYLPLNTWIFLKEYWWSLYKIKLQICAIK